MPERKIETKYAINMLDMVIQTMSYGLKRLEDEIFNRIRKNEIIVDKKRLLLESVKSSLLSSKESKDFIKIGAPILRIELIFDVVPEEDYMIGGKVYEEGRKRFEK